MPWQVAEEFELLAQQRREAMQELMWHWEEEPLVGDTVVASAARIRDALAPRGTTESRGGPASSGEWRGNCAASNASSFSPAANSATLVRRGRWRDVWLRPNKATDRGTVADQAEGAWEVIQRPAMRQHGKITEPVYASDYVPLWCGLLETGEGMRVASPAELLRPD